MLNKILNYLGSQKVLLLILGLAIVLSAVLAFYPIQKELHFSYDQSRDAFEAYGIWHNHNLKLLGPTTDIPGVFHGVIWYYILAIFYFLASNEPTRVGLLFLPVFLSSIPIIYFASKRFFGNKNSAAIATSIYSLLPILNVSTRWLSNPVLSLIIGPLLLLSIWEFIKASTKLKAFIIGILFGLLIQSDISFGLFGLTFPIFIYFFKVKIKLSHILFFLIGAIISVSSFILAELKFNFQSSRSMIEFLGKHGGRSPIIFITDSFGRFIDLIRTTVLPLPNEIIIIVLFIAFFILGRKALRENQNVLKFSLIWLSSILIFEIFNSGVVGTYFLFFPMLLPVVLITTILLKEYAGKYLGILILVILLLQTSTIYSWIKHDFTLLGVQQGASIGKQREVIDYTYKKAGGKPFTVDTVTNPLYINTTWAYAYEFYGKNKYGYLPIWGGHDQTGYLGELPTETTPTSLRFLIVEPPTGIDPFYIKQAESDEDVISNLVDFQYFGNYYIQIRQRK